MQKKRKGSVLEIIVPKFSSELLLIFSPPTKFGGFKLPQYI
jgi:hypothetical protein